jgi:peptidoglycan/LPS O-acetylase OafA/YrhL
VLGERLEYLDGWRGLAILMVLIAHFTPIRGIVLGRFGVDLFFVLSGLLMSRILFEQRMPIGLFYRRRISRIIPAFVLFVVLAVLIFGHTSAAELLSLLTFTRTYLPLHDPIWDRSSVVGHLWSLNVEEHCYMLLALIAVFTALRARVGSVLLGLSALTLAAVGLHLRFGHDPTGSWSINTECAATGLLASAGYRAIVHWRPPLWAVPLAILSALACYISVAPWYASVAFSPFLLAFAVNHVDTSPLRRVLEVRALGVLGLISYSVYLWQQPFYKYPLPYHLGLVGALATGAASFYLLESPLRRWLNANWRGREPRLLPYPRSAA